jgi:hypothetical protein
MSDEIVTIISDGSGHLAPDEQMTRVLEVAIAKCWPTSRPAQESGAKDERDGQLAWRFSGRTWMTPVASRRERPVR